MICDACREHRHRKCRGGTWCDCQHKPPAGDRGATPGMDPYEADDENTGEKAGGDGAEPGINWLRQG